MPRRIPALTAVAGALVVLATPGAASALTARFNQTCFGHFPTRGYSDPVIVSMTGGTPGAGFVLSATVPGHGSGSAGSASGTFDAIGNGVGSIPDVAPPSGTIGPTSGQVLQLSVQDYGAGAVEVPLGQILVSNIAMSIARTPRDVRVRRRISVSATGYSGLALYAFLVRGASTHVLRRIPLGTANVCGFATAKGIVAPRHVRTGHYRLYINPGTKLDKSRAIYSSWRIHFV